MLKKNGDLINCFIDFGIRRFHIEIPNLKNSLFFKIFFFFRSLFILRYPFDKFKCFNRTCESYLNVIERKWGYVSLFCGCVTTEIDSFFIIHKIDHSSIQNTLTKEPIFFAIMSDSTTACFFAKLIYSLTKVNTITFYIYINLN